MTLNGVWGAFVFHPALNWAGRLCKTCPDLPACRTVADISAQVSLGTAWLRKRSSQVVVECRTSLWYQVCVKLWVWQRNAPKLTDYSGRLNNRKKIDRHPDEIENEPSTLAPKSDEPTVLIPIEQQIQQRAYEFTSSAEGQTVTSWTIGFRPSAR